MDRIRHGLVLTLLGRPGGFVYKRSRRGDAEVDRGGRARARRARGEVRDFDPYGYDERQYCSPGFDLPVGRLTRTPHGEFPEYHTSADNLDLIDPGALADALETVAVDRRGAGGQRALREPEPEGRAAARPAGALRAASAAAPAAASRELALLWVLSLSDGEHSLLDMAQRSGLPFAAVRAAADALLEHELLGGMSLAQDGRRRSASRKGLRTRH